MSWCMYGKMQVQLNRLARTTLGTRTDDSRAKIVPSDEQRLEAYCSEFSRNYRQEPCQGTPVVALEAAAQD